MILVVGAGSWGTALASHLARVDRNPVTLWGRNAEQIQQMRHSGINQKYLPEFELPKNLEFTEDLTKAVSQAKHILMVVPSKGFRETLQQIKPNFTNQGIVCATKGLEPQTGRFLDALTCDVLGIQTRYAVLSGPSFAKEVMAQKPTAVTVASQDSDYAHEIATDMHSFYFRIYESNDCIGVQLGGVYKNILAVAAGISDGLQLGANARAALITRGLAEMMRLGKTMNAHTETMTGLSGCGDLILTATENLSRNRRFGLELGQGSSIEDAQAKIGQVVESVHNADELSKLAKQHQVELPIATQILSLLLGQVKPQQAMENLLSRVPKSENY